MPTPSIAIVIVNFHGLHDTLECLESLERITYQNWHVILVDNGSGSNEVVQLKNKINKRVDLIVSPTNLGFAGGNNIGIRKALQEKFDFILLLNNDTLVTTNFLTPLIDQLLSDSSIGIVSPKILTNESERRIWFAGGKIKWKTGVRISHCGFGEVDNHQYDTVNDSDFLTGCCMLFRPQLIEDTGLLPEEYFLYFEDADWSVHALRNGWKIKYVPSSTIVHKESSKVGKLSESKFYYLARNYPYFAIKYCNRFELYIFWLQYWSYNILSFVRNSLRKHGVYNKMFIHGFIDFIHHRMGQQGLRI